MDSEQSTQPPKYLRKLSLNRLRAIEQLHGFSMYFVGKHIGTMNAIYQGKYIETYCKHPVYAQDVANYIRFVVGKCDYLQFYFNGLEGDYKSSTHVYIATHYLTRERDINIELAIEHLLSAIELDNNNAAAHYELASLYNACFTGSLVYPSEFTPIIVPILTKKNLLFNHLTPEIENWINAETAPEESIYVVDAFKKAMHHYGRSADAGNKDAILCIFRLVAGANPHYLCDQKIASITLEAFERFLQYQKLHNTFDERRACNEQFCNVLRRDDSILSENMHILQHLYADSENRKIFLNLAQFINYGENRHIYFDRPSVLPSIIATILYCCKNVEDSEPTPEPQNDEDDFYVSSYTARIITSIMSMIRNSAFQCIHRGYFKLAHEVTTPLKEYDPECKLISCTTAFKIYLEANKNNAETDYEAINAHNRSIVSTVSTMEPNNFNIIRVTFEDVLGYNVTHIYTLLVRFPDLVNETINTFINRYCADAKAFVGPLIENLRTTECVICSGDVLCINLPCHETHTICLDCLPKITNNKCPYCRAPFQVARQRPAQHRGSYHQGGHNPSVYQAAQSAPVVQAAQSAPVFIEDDWRQPLFVINYLDDDVDYSDIASD